MKWYKYPMRAAQMNQAVSVADFEKVVTCVASLAPQSGA